MSRSWQTLSGVIGMFVVFGNSIACAAPIPVEEQAIAPDPEPVTPLFQLRDIQPTDWAFLAFQGLVERYGILVGYPDGSFQGDRPVNRYEFAAALQRFLGLLETYVAASPGNVAPENLATWQRLQSEFATELATLRDRTDRLEESISTLESEQFSTTSKLTGQTIFALSAGGFAGDRILDPNGREVADSDPNATLLFRVAFDVNTSFTGEDLLKLRIDTGSNGSLDNAAGFLEPNFGSILDISNSPPSSSNFGIGRLFYTFQAVPNLQVLVGAVLVPTDHIDNNRYAQLSFRDFSTEALVYNNLLFPISGVSSGALVEWQPKLLPVTLRALYVAADANNPGGSGGVPGLAPFVRLLYPSGRGDRGLFGDFHQGMVELEYTPAKPFTLRLQYSGGNVFDRRFDVFGANVQLTLSDRIGMFGRFGHGSFEDTSFGDLNPTYWMAGISFIDVGLSGSRSGIAVGQPFAEGDVGNATQTNIEAFYTIPINSNLQVTPLVQVITNAGNQDDNGAIVTGTLRTVFFF